MKEYNAKIIVNNDELKILFECDKEKNINCKGNGNCRECNYTTNVKYAKAKSRQEKLFDKEFEMIINDEEYLIKYNSNREINTIMLNASLIKLVNEHDKIAVSKDNEFRIINKTRNEKRNCELLY